MNKRYKVGGVMLEEFILPLQCYGRKPVEIY